MHKRPHSGDRCFPQGFGPLEQHRSVGAGEQAGRAKGAVERKSPETGCLSFLLGILDGKTEIFYSQGIIWVRPMQVSTRDLSLSLDSPDQCHTHASRAHRLGYSQAPRLLLLLSLRLETPFSRTKPSHLLPSESETASETLSCN